MSERIFQKDATSKSIYVLIRDANSTPAGLGKTGLVFNTSGLVFSYVRNGAARVAITLVTQTVTGAYSSGGFVEVDGTNMKGIYRLDVPAAALATGVDQVEIHWQGTGLVEDFIHIDLTSFDPIAAGPTVQNIVDGVWNELLSSHTTAGSSGERLGRVPNAAAGGNGGLPTVDANNSVKLQTGSGANQILLTAGAVTVGTNNDKTGYTASTVSDKTGYSLSATGADLVLDSANGVETALSIRGYFRLMAAVNAGKASGMATATNVFRNAVADSKPRVTATTDASGNRTAITYDTT